MARHRAAPTSYSEFLAFLFERPESHVAGQEWYWSENEDFAASDDVLVSHLTLLFQNCGADLAAFSDKQLAMGLNYIFNSSCSNISFALNAAKVDIAARIACINSIRFLYKDCLAVRCSEALGHLNEGEALNSFAYMLWDVTAIGFAAGDWRGGASLAAIIEVLEHALELKQPACAESALHGLSHLKASHAKTKDVAKRIESIIDRFLAQGIKTIGRREDLVAYAKRARRGAVL